MSTEGLTKALMDGLEGLEAIDAAIAEEIRGATPDELKKAFKKILSAMVPAALKDPLVRRNIKNHMIFLIERVSEKLQDLAETREIDNASDFMKWIDRAHRYAVRLASEKGDGTFVTNFDVDVRPASILDVDQRPPRERQARIMRLQEQYDKIRRLRGRE